MPPTPEEPFELIVLPQDQVNHEWLERGMIRIFNDSSRFRRRKLNFSEWEPTLEKRRHTWTDWKEEKIERLPDGRPEAIFRFRRNLDDGVLEVWMFRTDDRKIYMSQRFLERVLDLLS
jgi:hypothetical protein